MPVTETRDYGTVPIGRRDRWVTIEGLPDETDTQGRSGFPSEAWSPLVEHVTAMKQDVGGRERFVDNQLSTAYDTRWEIAYRPDMDPELVDVTKRRRLVYLGRTYDIVAAIMIGRREGIELLTLSRGVTP
jgi:hypothetical protein